jgi:hypothetical protein
MTGSIRNYILSSADRSDTNGHNSDTPTSNYETIGGVLLLLSLVVLLALCLDTPVQPQGIRVVTDENWRQMLEFQAQRLILPTLRNFDTC